MSKAKDISEIITDANFGGTLDVTGAITGASATLTGDITASSLNGGQLGGRRNLVINGAMQIAQRGTSATNAGGGYNTLDRWRFTQNTSGLGNFTAEQSTDIPSGEGFKSSLKMTNGSAKSISTDMTCYIETKFEGQDVQQLKYGTSSAENVTLSFFVRSSVTGTFCCHLFQAGNNKAHVKEYTISSANTFEKKTLTFTGDTATSLANDNTSELSISWVLGSGTGAHISADSWTSVPSAKGFCTSNQTNWITTNGATFYITGVQLEVGSVATPFEHRSFGETLALCQRYYEQWDIINGENIVLGTSYSGGNPTGVVEFHIIKRAAPTVTLPSAGASGNTISFLATNGAYASTVGSHSADRITTRGNRISGTGYSGITAASPTMLYGTGTPAFKFDSEL